MVMDFAPSPGAAWSDNFQSILDKALQEENARQAPRDYLGASLLGEDCLRKLAFIYHGQEKDADRGFKGSTLRIFARGHAGEERFIALLRLAGFKIVTEKADGGQIGFATGWSEEKQLYRIRGHCDGVITEAPYAAGLQVPCLWEMKVLGSKGWNDVKRKGVKVSKPLYYAQMQLYMAYLDLAQNPGLFTAENADNGDIYAEQVPFDAAHAQATSDKGAMVVQTQSPWEMPRVAREPTDFRCKFCDFARTCYEKEPSSSPAPTAPSWMNRDA